MPFLCENNKVSNEALLTRFLVGKWNSKRYELFSVRGLNESALYRAEIIQSIQHGCSSGAFLAFCINKCRRSINIVSPYCN